MKYGLVDVAKLAIQIFDLINHKPFYQTCILQFMSYVGLSLIKIADN